MNPEELKKRTKIFALRIIKLVKYLEQGSSVGRIIADRQLLRSGTAIFSNYRAACRARSVKDFISKLGIVAEEADETLGWLELLDESEIVGHTMLVDLLKEANELTAIMTASRNSAIKNQKFKKT